VVPVTTSLLQNCTTTYVLREKDDNVDEWVHHSDILLRCRTARPDSGHKEDRGVLVLPCALSGRVRLVGIQDTRDLASDDGGGGHVASVGNERTEDVSGGLAPHCAIAVTPPALPLVPEVETKERSMQTH